MNYASYKVRYDKTGEVFTKAFQPHHYIEAGTHPFDRAGMPHLHALTLMNKWNRQNAESGFTYWIE